jgi:hypothetical protein
MGAHTESHLLTHSRTDEAEAAGAESAPVSAEVPAALPLSDRERVREHAALIAQFHGVWHIAWLQDEFRPLRWYYRATELPVIGTPRIYVADTADELRAILKPGPDSCAHCGRTPVAGCPTHYRGQLVCKGPPDAGPDCLQRLIVHREPPGALLELDYRPSGVSGIVQPAQG